MTKKKGSIPADNREVNGSDDIPNQVFEDSLNMLYAAFTSAAQKYGPLHHQQLIQPHFADSQGANDDKEWSSKTGWAEFATVNSPANDSGWQQWHGPVEGLTYEWFGRFFGDPGGVDEFCSLADSFYLVLRKLDKMLPDNGGFELLLDLMHQAAASWPTTLLRSQESEWGLDATEAAILESDEATAAECDAIWNKAAVGPNGVPFFVHPTVETIQGHLYLAAAQFAKMIARDDLTLFLSEVHPCEPDYPTVEHEGTDEQDNRAVPEVAAPVPRWDEDSRSLWVGNTLVKRLMKPAKRQETVLRAFQEEGWPRRILDPLTGDAREYTIASLNRNHVNSEIIRFGKDGTGEGIIWFFVKRKP